MTELLISLALLGILIILGSYGIARYITLAQDAQRKDHLERYRVVFEEYFNDTRRYPESTALLNCGSNALSPYMPEILCDPATGNPYYYVVNASRTRYSLYAELANPDDELVTERNCQDGCGPDLDSDGIGDFNLGISDTGPVTGSSESIEQPPVGEEFPEGSIPGQCGSLQNPWCIAGVCSSCCPGNLRCDLSGTTCVPDISCEEP